MLKVESLDFADRLDWGSERKRSQGFGLSPRKDDIALT